MGGQVRIERSLVRGWFIALGSKQILSCGGIPQDLCRGPCCFIEPPLRPLRCTIARASPVRRRRAVLYSRPCIRIFDVHSHSHFSCIPDVPAGPPGWPARMHLCARGMRCEPLARGELTTTANAAATAKRLPVAPGPLWPLWAFVVNAAT